MHELGNDVAIFWDYENCPAPAGSSGWEIVKEIRRMAQVYGSIKVFKAYLELQEQSYPAESRSLQLRSELQASGVSLTDCPHNGRKDVADKMMLVDMMAHAIDNPAPLTYVLISGDRDFAYALAVLRLRCYQVILVTHSTAHNSLKSQATALFNWNSLLGRISPSSRNPPAQERDLSSAIPHHGSPTEGTFSLRSPFKGSVPYSSEQEDYKMYRAEMGIAGYPQRQRHSSISSGESGSLASSHEATTRTAYFSAQEASPLLTPLPNISHTNREYDAGSRPLPSSCSASQWTSTTGYTGHSRAEIPKYSFGNTQPAVPSVLAHETEGFSGIAPVFVHPSLASSPSSLPVRTTTNLTNSIPSATREQPPPPILPPIFQPLVDLLKVYRGRANSRPLRSSVALELTKQASTIYKKANVKKFGQYVALAEQSKIVTLGGREGDAWIALCPEWCR